MMMQRRRSHCRFLLLGRWWYLWMVIGCGCCFSSSSPRSFGFNANHQKQQPLAPLLLAPSQQLQTREQPQRCGQVSWLNQGQSSVVCHAKAAGDGSNDNDDKSHEESNGELPIRTSNQGETTPIDRTSDNAAANADGTKNAWLSSWYSSFRGSRPWMAQTFDPYHLIWSPGFLRKSLLTSLAMWLFLRQVEPFLVRHQLHPFWRWVAILSDHCRCD